MLITKKLIITNTLWSVVAQVLVMGVNLLILPLFITNLGADLYGIWVISNVVLGYLNVFDFGFTQGLQKYVAEARVKGDDRELSEVVVTGIGLLLVIGLFLGVGFWVGAPVIVEFFSIEPENQLIATNLLKISAGFCVVMWPLRIVDIVLDASMRIKELSFLNAFKTGTQSVVMLGMVWEEADVVLIKWVTSGLLALCSVYGLVLLKKYLPEISFQPSLFNVNQLKRMQKFSLGMFYAAVLGLFSIQIDILIIGKLLTMGAVTLYAVASKPFQMIQQIAGLFMRTIVPAAYTLGARKDLTRLEALVSQGVRMRSLVSIPVCVIAFLCVQDFLELWVGNNFVDAVQWTQYFLLVPIFACLGVGANVCKVSGGLRLVNSLASAKIMLNLIVSIVLIRPLGIGGPILGTVISNLILGDMAFFWLYCKKTGIGSKLGYWYFVQVLLASLFAGALAWAGMRWADINGVLGLAIRAGFGALMQVVCVGVLCSSRNEKYQVMDRLKGALGRWA
jgi:O-antigen/teichoic acid export membrane protein